jgi:hypothetical protein
MTMNSRDYKSNCDVLSISSYSSDSKNTETRDDGNGSDSEDFYIPYDITAAAVEEAAEAAEAAEAESRPSVDPNDPLRYFLERGEITPNEYEKWKLVKEEPCCQIQPLPMKHKRKTPDFGPGYNSDSDSDSDSDNDEDNHDNDDDNSPTIEYGNGYSEHADEHTDPCDPWNPTPDTTSDRRYTNIANNSEFMLKRLTQDGKLSSSFGLKLIWERFAIVSSQRHQTLQDFWQENALQIYEALQELVETQAVGGGEGGGEGGQVGATPASYEYHSTPFETLDNTFETIGRMCRCIAEEFNTSSVVAYVEEFIVSLYREIEFGALVEEHKNKMREQRQRQ